MPWTVGRRVESPTFLLQAGGRARCSNLGNLS
jgi:hypothetical protein